MSARVAISHSVSGMGAVDHLHISIAGKPDVNSPTTV